MDSNILLRLKLTGSIFCHQMELEDVAPLKKLRIGHDGKGDRPEWFLEKVIITSRNSVFVYFTYPTISYHH